jgi:hypothetical protein
MKRYFIRVHTKRLTLQTESVRFKTYLQRRQTKPSVNSRIRHLSMELRTKTYQNAPNECNLARTNDCAKEPDAVYLNIQENGGKIEMWSKYRALLQEYLHFDSIIGIVDTDALVFSDRFSSRLSLLPRFPNNARAYGGLGSIKPVDIFDTAKEPSYILGRFYWTSPDLARFITSNCSPIRGQRNWEMRELSCFTNTANASPPKFL